MIQSTTKFRKNHKSIIIHYSTILWLSDGITIMLYSLGFHYRAWYNNPQKVTFGGLALFLFQQQYLINVTQLTVNGFKFGVYSI
jgi:hypothetical protein